MQTVMSTLAETWKRRYLAEGKAEGLAIGQAEGERKALILLAEQRFGSLPPALRQRIEVADAGSIEGWLGRLLDATSLEGLFGSAN